MEVPGDEFLARAVRAQNEHPGIGGSHPVDDVTDVLNCIGFAYHLLPVHLFLEYLGLLYETAPLGSVAKGNLYAVHILKRLLNEIEGALLYALHGCVYIAVAGNHYHGRIHALLTKPVQHLQTVHIRHLNVAEDGVIVLLDSHGQSLLSVLCGLHIVSEHAYEVA